MHKIKNLEKLIGNSPHKKARQQALELIETGMDAIDAKKAVQNSVSINKNILKIRNETINLKSTSKIFVVGCGKASGIMAEELEKILGKKIETGTVVSVEKAKTKKIKVLKGTHPLPSNANIAAGKKILSLAKKAGKKDLVISLVSGGGSALLCLPAKGIELAHLQKMNELLIKCGAPIEEINTVRKHISGIKGGLLAKAAFPARIVSLIISDVVGDRLDAIASGPTVPDTTTYNDVLQVLKKHGLWEKIPCAVKRHLEKGVKGLIDETPKQNNPLFRNASNHIILNNVSALNAMHKKAVEMELNPTIVSAGITGEAIRVGEKLVKEAEMAALETESRPILFLWGGETTVTVKGSGRGGRNLELVLGGVMELEKMRGSVMASFATDGIDGSTDTAGAIADSDTLKRAREKGRKIGESIKNNDSFSFFDKLGDCIYTGYTKMNVMDLQLILIGKQNSDYGDIEDIEDKLAARKMQKISEEIRQGKRKVFTERQVKKKYGL